MKYLKVTLVSATALILVALLTACSGKSLVLPQMALVMQPGNGIAGEALSPAIKVEFRDAGGNLVTAANGTVTLSLGANPGQAVLGGTLSQLAVNGVATFDDISVSKKGLGYTLIVNSPGLPALTSDLFNIFGKPIRLAFTVQPLDTMADQTITPKLVVEVQGSMGERVETASHEITLAIGNNPGQGVLSGTLVRTAVNGRATFSNLSIDKKGQGYTLAASATGLNTGTTDAFNVLHKPATQLAFIVQPGNTTAGESITPAVEVELRDVDGNRVTEANQTVALALGRNPGGGVLTGPVSLAAQNGVASFTGLKIDQAGSGYQLKATVPGLTDATSMSFDVLTRPATQLAFITQPTTTLTGESIEPAVVVELRNVLGERVESANLAVTISLATNPSAGTLSGTMTRNAIDGRATFPGLSVDKAGAAYTLQATAEGLTGAVSGGFDIVAKPAAKLVFTIQPANTTAGEAITPDVKVEIRDRDGALLTTAANPVTLNLGSNPTGGTLSGTMTREAVGGVATFAGLQIEKSGDGYKLLAASPGLTGGLSNAFNILPRPATRLAFTVQPVNTVAGEDILPSVVVEVQNALGRRVEGADNLVTFSLATNPSGGALTGALTQKAVNGRATFPGLKIDKHGENYKLQAAADTLSGALSDPFSILARPANKLVYAVQPSNTTASEQISPAVVVEIQDSLGQRVAGAENLVTMALGANTPGGTLQGVLSRKAVDGRATFAGLNIDKQGDGYKLRALSGGLTEALSNGFNILPRPATKLAFTVEPRNTIMGEPISPAVVVEIRNSLDQRVSGAIHSVALAIGTNPAGGTLTGTLTRNAIDGRATFEGLNIDKIGNGYQLQATTAGLTGAMSKGFDILPREAARLVLTSQVQNTVAAEPLTPVISVEIRDADDKLVTTAQNTVNLAIDSNPGSGILSGTLTRNAANGVVTFPGLSIEQAGEGYTIKAQSTGLLGATSNSFNILPRPATQLAFTVQPSKALAGENLIPAILVEIQNALGQRVATADQAVTLTLGANPGQGTLSGTLTRNAVDGRAIFEGLSIDKPAEGYRIQATATNLSTATSAPFNIGAQPATQLAFTVQPAETIAGEHITPDIVVEVRDKNGALVKTATQLVTLAIDTNPSHGVLHGVLTRPAMDGKATFPGLKIDREGTGYTLHAAAAGLTGALSNGFNILPRPAIQMAFTVQPANTLKGKSMVPAVVVEIRNNQGQRVETATNSVTLALGANPGQGTLAGTLTVNAVTGRAVFEGLSINMPAQGYTLEATSSGLANRLSDSFDILPLPPVQLVFAVQPGSATAWENFTPDLVVEIRDQEGVRVETATHTVTLALGHNPAGGVLSGILTRTAADGKATFPGLKIDKVGQGYKLQATAIGLADGVSDAFDILPRPPAQLAFTVQPSHAMVLQGITPSVVVEVQNDRGERVDTAAHAVTMALGANPGNGALSGTLTQNAVAGRAVFPGLKIDKVGEFYRLKATATGLTDGVSGVFNIIAGPAAKLAFTVQPQHTMAGQPLAPAVEVQVLDALGNLVTTADHEVTVSIGARAGSNVFHTKSLAIDLIDSSSARKVRTLTPLAQQGGYEALAYNEQDGLVYGYHTDWNQNHELRSLDPVTGAPTFIARNTLFRDYGIMGFAFQNGTLYAVGSGSSFSKNLDPLFNDENRFNDSKINESRTNNMAKAAKLYTLSTTTGQLTLVGQLNRSEGAISLVGSMETDPVSDMIYAVVSYNDQNKSKANIAQSRYLATIEPATQLATIIGKVGWLSRITFRRDGTLIGMVDENSSDAGALYEIDKSSGAMTFLMARTEQIYNRSGNQLTWVPAELSGATKSRASGGVATFSNLAINAPGNGYTLKASVEGLAAALSPPFDIMSLRATKLAFTTEPASTEACKTITPAVAVELRNAHDVHLPGATDEVAISIGDGPREALLMGETKRAAQGGVAIFEGLSLSPEWPGYTLKAVIERTGAMTVSEPFDIFAGTSSPRELAFSVQPGSTGAGSVLPPFKVEIRDLNGQLVTGEDRWVTLSLEKNPGSNLLHSYGCPGNSSVCSPVLELIDHTSPAVLGPLPITLPAVRLLALAYDIQTQMVYGLNYLNHELYAIDPVKEAYQNIGKITWNGGNTSILRRGFAVTPQGTLYAAEYSGSPCRLFSVDKLTGALTQVGTSGIQSDFGDVREIKAMEADPTEGKLFAVARIYNRDWFWYLISIDPALNPPAAHAIGQLSNSNIAGITFRRDGSMVGIGGGTNQSTTGKLYEINKGTASMTQIMELSHPAGGEQITWLPAMLKGQTTVRSVNGVATFDQVHLTAKARGYVLKASACNAKEAFSKEFNINSGNPAKLAFTQQPGSSTMACRPLSPPLTVEVRNEDGDLLTGHITVVTLHLRGGGPDATINGTLARETLNGVATFDDLAIDRVGTGYVLEASAPGGLGSKSTPFSITPSSGAAAYLAFGTQPVDGRTGQSLPAFTVELRDNGGQLVTDEDRTVTLSLYNNPGRLIFHTSGDGDDAVFELVEPSIPTIIRSDKVKSKRVRGLAYNPQDGRIYGSSNGSLFYIDPRTMILTPIQADKIPNEKPRGFAFKDGALYVAGESRGGPVMLYSFNPSTLAVTEVGPLTLPGRNVMQINGMETDPLTGVIYGIASIDDIICNLFCKYLVTIDPATLTITDRGSLNENIVGLTFLADGTMIGVSGDSEALLSETLYTIDRDSAALTVLLRLGNGGQGEQLTWVPAMLGGTITVQTVNGVATFSDVLLNALGSGYSLLASGCGVSPGISAAFDINTGVNP